MLNRRFHDVGRDLLHTGGGLCDQCALGAQTCVAARDAE